MADWKDILNDNERPLSDDDLLHYMNANSTVGEKEEIKNIAAAGNFESDALEGLQKIQNPALVKKQVTFLKRQLKKNLRNYKMQRRKQSPKAGAQWIVYTVIALLLTCIITYLLIVARYK